MSRKHTACIILISLFTAITGTACEFDDLFARIRLRFDLPSGFGQGAYVEDVRMLEAAVRPGLEVNELVKLLHDRVREDAGFSVMHRSESVSVELFCDEELYRSIEIVFWLNAEARLRRIAYTRLTAPRGFRTRQNPEAESDK